jgi:hypothetical protein
MTRKRSPESTTPTPGQHGDGSEPNAVRVPTHGGTYVENPDGTHTPLEEPETQAPAAPSAE